jgi:hypothetical protein
MTVESVDLSANNYYELLGVESVLTTEEITEETRRYINTLHPDKPDNNVTTDEYKRVKEAVDVLTDEEKRREYDANQVLLRAEVDSTNLPVFVDDEITLSVEEVNKETVTQYEISADGETRKTDGNGEIDIAFSNPGEKQIRIDKQDRGTIQYIPDEVTVEVKDKQDIQLEMQLQGKDGKPIQGSAKAGQRITVKVVNANTGSPVNKAIVKHADNFTKTGKNGEASITLTNTDDPVITCKKQDTDRRKYRKTQRGLSLRKQNKQLDIDIEYKELYAGDVLKFNTKTIRQGMEPHVTVTLTDSNGNETQYQSDENGVFKTRVTTTGTVHIELSKGETKTARYSPCQSSIYVKESTALDVTVKATNKKDWRETGKNIHVKVNPVTKHKTTDANTPGNTDDDIIIDLRDPTKFANGVMLETVRKTNTVNGNKITHTFSVDSNGAYEIVVTGDGYQEVTKEILVNNSGSDSTNDEDGSNNTTQSIINTLKSPFKLLTTTLLSGTALPNTKTPIPKSITTAPKSKPARIGVIGIWLFTLVFATTTLLETPNTTLWGGVTATIYILPMLYPRIGGWCYGLVLPQYNSLATTEYFQSFNNPSITAASVFAIPLLLSLLHYKLSYPLLKS